MSFEKIHKLTGGLSLTKYIIKRIAMGLLSIFIVATLTFFLMNLVPGGPFVAENP